MATWQDRLKEARQNKGFDKKSFARLVGVSGATATDWESGEIKEIKGPNLIAACRALGVSPEWLLTGREAPAGSPGDVTDTIPDGARVMAWEHLSDLPDAAAYVTVPHYDVELSAGCGCEWVAHPHNEPLVFRLRWFEAKGVRPHQCRALYVRGASMEPTLLHGDTVLIDTMQTEIRDDSIYAIVYHGELFVKRLFRLPGGGAELRSDNPRHPTRSATGEDANALIVLGLVIWRAG